MKGKKLFLTAALALVISVNAFAQYGMGIGIKGGIAGNWMPYTTLDWGDVITPHVGCYAGVFGFMELSDVVFGQVELLYTLKGCRTTNELLGKYTRNIHYLQLPVLIGFKMADDAVSIALGPGFAYCLGSNVKSDAVNPSSLMREIAPFNLSGILQARYAMTDAFGVELRFDYGITRTFKSANNFDDKAHNATVQIGLSYLFGQ